jgi:cell division protein FtsW (lipid II flippase)
VWWSDFSLTYLIYQWGLVVGVLLVALFLFLMLKMIRAAMRQKNALGFIISLSAITAIGMQCALFFSANLGICQLVTLPLPLVTTGQTCFIVDMALIGLLLSAYRNIDVVRNIEAPHPKFDSQ